MTMTTEEVTEAQAQLVTVDSRITEVYAGIGVAAGAGEDISSLTLEYGALIAERGGLRQKVNGRLIENEKSAVFQAIGQLVASSKLPELLDEPITTLVWSVTPGSGENGPINDLKINPKVMTARGRKTGSGMSTGGKGSGRIKFSDGTEVFTARELVLKFGSKETLDLALVAHGEGKWVTKPAHVTAALENAETNGFNLVKVEE